MVEKTKIAELRAIAQTEEGLRVVTHGGVFHADDVFCTALILSIVEPAYNNTSYTYLSEHSGLRFRHLDNTVTIIRTNNMQEIHPAHIVYDIGRVYDPSKGMFDHHQDDSPAREDQPMTPYAAFGLLWKEYGPLILPSTWRQMDTEFVQEIDAADNGVRKNIMSNVISYMNPLDDSDDGVHDEGLWCFTEAIFFALAALKKVINRFNQIELDASYVSHLYKVQGNGCAKTLILPHYKEYEHALVNTPCERVIYPSKRGGFSLTCIPVKVGSFKLKRPLPESWLIDDKRPAGCTFVHKNRFMAHFTMLEDALTAARILDFNSDFHH